VRERKELLGKETGREGVAGCVDEQKSSSAAARQGRDWEIQEVQDGLGHSAVKQAVSGRT
jgi:hypothetical protein